MRVLAELGGFPPEPIPDIGEAYIAASEDSKRYGAAPHHPESGLQSVSNRCLEHKSDVPSLAQEDSLTTPRSGGLQLQEEQHRVFKAILRADGQELDFAAQARRRTRSGSPVGHGGTITPRESGSRSGYVTPQASRHTTFQDVSLSPRVVTVHQDKEPCQQSQQNTSTTCSTPPPSVVKYAGSLSSRSSRSTAVLPTTSRSPGGKSDPRANHAKSTNSLPCSARGKSRHSEMSSAGSSDNEPQREPSVTPPTSRPDYHKAAQTFVTTTPPTPATCGHDDIATACSSSARTLTPIVPPVRQAHERVSAASPRESLCCGFTSNGSAMPSEPAACQHQLLQESTLLPPPVASVVSARCLTSQSGSSFSTGMILGKPSWKPSNRSLERASSEQLSAETQQEIRKTSLSPPGARMEGTQCP